MIALSYAISKIIVDEYGKHELLRRLADPLWFQAFGCVLGFDWHSSGVTTVVTGVLKQSLKEDVHGISIAGGKGSKSTATKNDIPRLAEKHYNLPSAKIDDLLYASKMAAKIDNAAVQDGYALYHHVILFDGEGNWTVVQQGMDPNDRMARRYHWISDNLKSFVYEPHTGIISRRKIANTLNMTSVDSEENRKLCVELATGNIDNLKSSIYKIATINKRREGKTLDDWIRTDRTDDKHNVNNNNNYGLTERYEMPHRLDWNVFRRIYDIQPKNYEQLVSISGVGSGVIRAALTYW
jgi:uncharacterized protein